MSDWSKELMSMTTGDVIAYLGTGVRRDTHQLAVEELQRRYLQDVQREVAKLAGSSQALESLTATLIRETANVHREVALLADSSGKLETLTITLKNLTWALIFLTMLAVMVPIGLEIWKAYK